MAVAEPEPGQEPARLARAPLQPGAELEGRYRIVALAGRGGMGEVYEGVQLRLQRRVAIKVLRAEVSGSRGVRQRFEREARAMAQLNSDHIVTLFDCGVGPDGAPYLVMEFLEGCSVRQLLQAQGPLVAPRAVRLIHDACLGVAAAHAKGVIHRDLKPENLFVVQRESGGETCKVLDFGLAKLRAAGWSEGQTKLGSPLGTLHYMSPEQARGDIDIDERTDVYACAAVLYEMLSGRRVHEADEAPTLLYKIVHQDPTPLTERCEQVPPGLAAVIHWGLVRRREGRPSGIREWILGLEPFLAGGAPELPAHGETVATEVASQHQNASRRAPVGVRASRLLAVTCGSALLAGALVWALTSKSRASATGPVGAASTPMLEVVPPVLEPTPSEWRRPSLGSAATAVGSAPLAPKPAAAPPRPRPRVATKPPPQDARAADVDVEDEAATFERRNPYE